MLESLRGLGYNTAAAIADLIDNSISAEATTIEILFAWQGDRSWIRIIDNGRGMSDSELESAMRLGARDPRNVRKAGDLGRFGMGLKTASFSQARVLTVASRVVAGTKCCLRWDLDDLGGETGSWLLHEGARPGSEPRLEAPCATRSGTVVLWENLDRIVTEGFKPDDFIELSGHVEAHLAMTFHRLLDDGIEVSLNGRAIRGWDPFLTGHPGKALQSVEYKILNAPGVVAQCHVLPHKDLLKSSEFESAAGPSGWTAQQGFYVYRNRRLLLTGGWLGLGERGRRWTRDEPHRLARIRLDIPNSADFDWKINILKSTASVPVRLRGQLVRLASETREVARRVFAHRGRLMTGGGHGAGRLPDVWQSRHSSKGISYGISRDHVLVASILDRAGPLKGDLVSLLRLIEETVPVQRIWLDTSEQNQTPKGEFAAAPAAEIEETLISLYEALVEFRGMAPDEARERLARTHPFDQYPEIVDKIGRNN
ncbi:ATP-binding protein [Novosphingobium sp.]|uniref:ATP-binding protein n=1 Tax=Novosphingobium sp. TaxID=1874826 RepID=UPI003B520309